MTFKLTSVHLFSKLTHSKAIGCTVTCGIKHCESFLPKSNRNNWHPSKVRTFIWIMKNIIYKGANVPPSMLCKSKSRAFDTIPYSPDMKLDFVVIVAVCHTHHTAPLT